MIDRQIILPYYPILTDLRLIVVETNQYIPIADRENLLIRILDSRTIELNFHYYYTDNYLRVVIRREADRYKFNIANFQKNYRNHHGSLYIGSNLIMSNIGGDESNHLGETLELTENCEILREPPQIPLVASMERPQRIVGEKLRTPNVVWYVNHGLRSGYGVADINYIKGLLKAGFKPKVVFSADHDPSLEELTRLDYDDIITVNYAQPTYWNGRGRYRIGFTVYETTKIPPHWTGILNTKAEEVWTASKFCKTTFENSGVKNPIYVFPHCIPLEYYSPQGSKLDLGTGRDFTFYSVGDLHGRKAWDVYLGAFVDEFSPQENVCAVFRTYAGIEETWRAINKLRDKRPLPKIKVIGEQWINDIGSLYRAVNAIVIASRGEGFGLIGLEGMACGCSVIGTSWGGQTEYITHENSFLVDYEYTVVHSMDVFEDYRTLKQMGALFAEPDIKSLREKMRGCYEDEGTRRHKIRRALEDVKKFEDRIVAAKMKERFNQIWEGFK